MSIFDTAYEGAGPHANYAGFGVQFGMANVKVIANLITGGVCHRFPDLKFVSVESGIGWIPFALDHLDWQWKNCGVPEEHPEYDLLPSEYFKRQMYGCFWFEDGTVKAAIDQCRRRLDPLRERLPAPHQHVARDRPRPPWSLGSTSPTRWVICRRTCFARSSTTTPPSSITWIDAFSWSQRGVQGMADDYASVDVDLGMVAPATEHWKQIDALAGSASVLPQHEWQLLGVDPLRRHPRGVPEPRGVLQPLDRAHRPGSRLPVPSLLQRPAPAHEVPPDDEPLVRSRGGHEVLSRTAAAGARDRGRGVRRRRHGLPEDLRRPLPGSRSSSCPWACPQDNAEFFVDCVRLMSGGTDSPTDESPFMVGWNRRLRVLEEHARPPPGSAPRPRCRLRHPHLAGDDGRRAAARTSTSSTS